MLTPSDVGIILSYQCQSRCAHCIYNCGPQWKDWMAIEQVKRALDVISTWDHACQIHFTGGEPFLDFPLLLTAVEMAAEMGIPRYIETNADWCVDEEKTRQRFRMLKYAGLQAILISCSPFHAESIPLVRTMMAIRLGIEVFGLNRVIVYQPQWLDQVREFDEQEKVPLQRYLDAHGETVGKRMLWDGYGVISGGRAGYRLGEYTRKVSAEAFQQDSCRGELLHAPHSHFDLYGHFIPSFCGGLSLGKWEDFATFKKSCGSGEYSQLMGVLIESGPYGLYQIAAEHYGYAPVEEGYAGKCHLCVDVRRFLITQHPFAELQPAAFYDNLDVL